MTGPQIKFAQGIAQGLNQTEAYKAAYPKSSQNAAVSNGARLMLNDNISRYVDELRAEAHSKAVISVRDRMEFLTGAILTPLSEIDETSPLCTEHTTDQLGSEIVRVKYKKVDQLKALDLLNKMDGAYAAEKHALTVEDNRQTARDQKEIGAFLDQKKAAGFNGDRRDVGQNVSMGSKN